MFVALWAALRTSNARLIGGLEAQIKEKDRVITEKDAVIAMLGDKCDKLREKSEEREKQISDQKQYDQDRMVRTLLAARAQGFGSSGGPWEEEAPTGVRNVLDLLTPSVRPRPPGRYGGPPR